ncbi:MAG: histidinol dehydrogenase [Deltaproteobacteria bacterium]|nr:histidinol dehydrogenase [Deltaproteobacteria bacterium]
MLTIERFSEMTPQRLSRIMARSTDDYRPIMEQTLQILERLKDDPQKELLREYGLLKDDLTISDFKVTEKEIQAAVDSLPKTLMTALEKAMDNIVRFHRSQLERPLWFTEVSPGILAGRMTRPLDKVGVYIPGGRASYPSSALMNIIPAKVASVNSIIAVTPPSGAFAARPEILAACHLAGATEIYKLGGAWAVGCLTYGLAGVPKVDKIVGPGSSWVTAAKMAVFGQVDVDLPAGPSEGFIIADGQADPSCLAWDFLSQLEHDPQASAILVTNDMDVAEKASAIVNRELETLERSEIVRQSITNAAILLVDDLEQAFDLANRYAPEHLEIVVDDPMSKLGLVQNAGSVFLGPFSPIPAGDYASGPNHVLPTGGAARAFSGLSVDSFLKKITFQKLSRQALSDIAPTVVTLAKAEGLPAHARCLEQRELKNS